MMKLYGFFRSSTSFRLRIALAWKGLPYETETVSLPNMAHKAPGFLSVNPQGLVPALIDDDGKVFTQSLAMIEWLDEKYPTPSLMPADIDERWYVRAASQILGCELHPLNNVRVLKYIKSSLGATAEQSQEWYEHWLAEGMSGLEKFLVTQKRHGKFCLGDQFTMADVCLVPQIYNAMRFNCDLAPYPAAMAIFQNCDALDCVRTTEPSTQPDKF
jgi:maleylacetoacetate isomerase